VETGVVVMPDDELVVALAEDPFVAVVLLVDRVIVVPAEDNTVP
jgi:hypothetical protein